MFSVSSDSSSRYVPEMDRDAPGPNLAGTAADAAGSSYGPDRRAAERTERYLAVLDQIVDHGVALIGVIRNQAEDARWCGAEGPPMVDQLARAIRQTMAFAEKLDADARMTAEQRAAALVRREAAELRAASQKCDKTVGMLSAAFDRIAGELEAEGMVDPAPRRERGPKTDREFLLRGMKERFGDPTVDDQLNGRPYGEILTTILEDIGATADLSVFPPEMMTRVYGPAQLRRRAAAAVAPQAAAVGGGGGSVDPSGTVEPPAPPQQRPPGMANGHDPP
jgi:hypothetical protein